MQLLLPEVPDQTITVLVRNEYETYDIKLVNAQTHEETEYEDTPTVSEGIATFTIPSELTAKNWYNFFAFYNDVLQNYTMIYCDTNTDQQYSGMGEYFDVPDEEVPEYKMAD